MSWQYPKQKIAPRWGLSLNQGPGQALPPRFFQRFLWDMAISFQWSGHGGLPPPSPSPPPPPPPASGIMPRPATSLFSPSPLIQYPAFLHPLYPPFSFHRPLLLRAHFPGARSYLTHISRFISVTLQSNQLFLLNLAQNSKLKQELSSIYSSSSLLTLLLLLLLLLLSLLFFSSPPLPPLILSSFPFFFPLLFFSHPTTF